MKKECIDFVMKALPIISRGGIVGSSNLNGISTFALSPNSATIAPHKELEVTVTFQPDHVSLHYLAHAVLHVSDEVEDLVVRLIH
jgi:hypothetical protein